MKVKYLPIISFLLLLAGLVWSGWLVATQSPGRVDTQDIIAIKHNSTDFIVPGKETLAQVEQIGKKLILIANPRVEKRSEVDLSFFAKEDSVILGGQVASTGASRSTEHDNPFAYNITFTFISEQNQYCYIDNKFYQQGDVMPDGGKISRIEPHQVLIIKNNIAEWIPVKSN